jgi:hypothetical protein
VISIPFPESGMRLPPCDPFVHDTMAAKDQA